MIKLFGGSTRSRGVAVFAEQPHYFFALMDAPPLEDHDLIPIIDIDLVVFPRSLVDADDQVEVDELVHRLDDHLPLHAGLSGDVLVAVPADVHIAAEALAEE